MLTVTNLTVDIAGPEGALRVVNDVSFSLAAGETLALVGESGCGKSMTALAIMRLAQKKVLVHDMKCIETLARVDVLCVDKTGTITENDMAVDGVIPLNDAIDLQECQKHLADFVSCDIFVSTGESDRASPLCGIGSLQPAVLFTVFRALPLRQR